MGDNVYGDCDEETREILRQAYVEWGESSSVQASSPTLAGHGNFGTTTTTWANDCHVDNPYERNCLELLYRLFSN
jgi:hypothetical protein